MKEKELVREKAKKDLENWNKILTEVTISLNDIQIRLNYLNKEFQELYEEVNEE